MAEQRFVIVRKSYVVEKQLKVDRVTVVGETYTVQRVLGFSSSREWNPKSYLKEIGARMKMQLQKFDQFMFGGALGGDTYLLETAYRVRSRMVHPKALLIVVCPNTLADLPGEARQVALRCADECIELKYPIREEDGFAAYHKRNDYIIQHSKEMSFYWNGRSPGTKSTIDKARASNVPSNVYIVH